MDRGSGEGEDGTSMGNGVGGRAGISGELWGQGGSFSLSESPSWSRCSRIRVSIDRSSAVLSRPKRIPS